MPPHPHPDHALSFAAPHDDAAWMRSILSQSETDLLPISQPRCSQHDDLMRAIEADLPSSSFRLQVLRAWAAASAGGDAEAAGHA
jgi:ATP/maltotriose-dependent transcriptional regulator MalT